MRIAVTLSCEPLRASKGDGVRSELAVILRGPLRGRLRMTAEF